MNSFVFRHSKSRLQICPQKTFSQTSRHRWYQTGSKYCFPGFGGLIQGQIYNPVNWINFPWIPNSAPLHLEDRDLPRSSTIGCLEFQVTIIQLKPLLKYRCFIILDGGFKHFLFSPLPREMIQFDEHIFQMGWFNHQLQ